MSRKSIEEEVKFYPKLVKGELKQGTLILSNNLPALDSLLAVVLLSPEFKTYFEDPKTYEALKTMAAIPSLSQLMHLPIKVNNCVQQVQLNDQSERLFLKDLTSKIENLSTITTFKNTFDNMGVTLKFLS